MIRHVRRCQHPPRDSETGEMRDGVSDHQQHKSPADDAVLRLAPLMQRADIAGTLESDGVRRPTTDSPVHGYWRPRESAVRPSTPENRQRGQPWPTDRRAEAAMWSARRAHRQDGLGAVTPRGDAAGQRQRQRDAIREIAGQRRRKSSSPSADSFNTAGHRSASASRSMSG